MIVPRAIARPLDRITWRDGQRLAAADLRDEQHFDERLWRLHIRYLHGAWGVVEGLEVVLAGVGAVLVSDGYALDGEGAVLLKPLAERVGAPASIGESATFYLTLSRGADNGGCDDGRCRGCRGERDSAAIDQGILAWKRVNEVSLALDVLLARVLVANGRIDSVIDTSIQRRARRLDPPRTWSDATQKGQTGWADIGGGETATIEAQIDTSEGGFTRAPAYFAQLVNAPPAIAGYIDAAGTGGFTFAVSPIALGNARGAAQAEAEGWTVEWLAVEIPTRRPDPLKALAWRLP